MPERQSSPGEATARPKTDGATNDDTTNDHEPTRGAAPADGSNSAAPSPTPAPGPAAEPAPPSSPEGAKPAEQAAAEPPAAEPAPARPDGGTPAVDTPTAGTPTAGAPSGADGPTAATAAAPAPRPRPTPGPTPGDETGAPAAEAAPGPFEPDRPRPRPYAVGDTVQAPIPAPAASPDGPTRPTPGPSESPTVAVPRPPAAAQNPTAQIPAGPHPAGPNVTGAGAFRAAARAGGPHAPWDVETTQVIPLNTTAANTTAVALDPPTERIPVIAASGPPTPPSGGPAGPSGRSRRPLLIVAAVVAVLALVYVADLLLSSGSVPRGVTVAGVSVGGLALADAEQELRTAIEPRAQRPVAVTVGEVSAELDPATSGLAVDWAGTLAQAGEQPLNPFTRIASLFTSRELGVVTAVDRAAVEGALGELGPVVDRPPAEGTVRFEDTTPVPVDPVAGQRLDQVAAIDVLERDWASGITVALPLIPLPAVTTPDDVDAAVRDVATPAVSAPVTVIGEENTEGVLTPETIAEALSFEPGAQGGLDPVLNPTVVTDSLTPQLAGSEREARDAELNFATTPPSVVPSQDGRGVDYDATLADLLSVLTGTGPREITAVYSDQPAELTTAELEGLGVSGEISRFQTQGFAADSGQNIRRAAELVDGTVVEPGATFSLDAVTGPRTAANGYVEAGIIDNGQPGRGIAGGVSQVSTTLFNAAYFAGMTDVEHTPHSFYISRYPPGREATIATGAIDMKFRNDTPTAVLIRTEWTPSSITVMLYGTKYFEVTSAAGPRTNPTMPNTVTIPPGEPCNPSNGAPGFTITDTRTLRNLTTGEVRTERPRATRYNPSPKVVCG